MEALGSWCPVPERYTVCTGAHMNLGAPQGPGFLRAHVTIMLPEHSRADGVVSIFVFIILANWREGG